jgi:hypothetical protein
MDISLEILSGMQHRQNPLDPTNFLTVLKCLKLIRFNLNSGVLMLYYNTTIAL